MLSFKNLLITSAVCLLSTSVFAKDDVSTMNSATEALNDILAVRDKNIPQSLLDKAEAIAVIPDVVKAAFTIGGRYGKGVISVKKEDGSWSNPSFIRITGGSVGAQIGVESTDLILLFKSRESVDKIAKGDFTLGATASVAAGPIGRQAGASTNYTFDAEILSYSKSKGLFAGIALDGSSLSLDRDANENVYGDDITTDNLLKGEVTNPPEAANAFSSALKKHTD